MSAAPNHRLKGGWVRPDPLGWLALSLIIVGVVVRLRVFLYNRSLWFDEAALALNIVDKSYLDLLRTGQYAGGQVPPVGFSLVERLVVGLLGPFDWAMRLVPLIAGLAALPLLYVVVRRIAGRVTATVSVGFLAFGWRAVYFSGEMKAYGTDLFAAIFLFWLMGTEPERLTRQRAIALGVAGALLCFVSQPLVFVMAAYGLGLAVVNLKAGPSRERVAPLAIVATLWVVAFALNWWLFLRPQMVGSEWLYEDHAVGFLPLVPGSVEALRTTGTQLARTFGGMSGFKAPELAVFLFAAGLVKLAVRRKYLGLAFAVPWLVAYVASGFEIYPFRPRLMMFGLPGVLFTMAYGLHTLAGHGRGRRILALVGFLAVGWFNLAQTAGYLADPGGQYSISRTQTRSGLEYIRGHARSGDALYVYHGTAPAVRFYRDQILPDDLDIVYGQRRDGPSAFDRDVRHLARASRAWVLFNRFSDREDRRYILAQIERIGGMEADRYEFRNEPDGAVSAYLFRFPPEI